MNISDVIKNAGDDQVEVQSIATSIVKVQQKKHDCELTIAVSKGKGHELMAGLTSGHMPVVGILVWMTREQWANATATPVKKRNRTSKGNS